MSSVHNQSPVLIPSPPRSPSQDSASGKRKRRETLNAVATEVAIAKVPRLPKLSPERSHRKLAGYYGVDFDSGDVSDEALKELLNKVESRLEGVSAELKISIRRAIRNSLKNARRQFMAEVGVIAHYPLDLAAGDHLNTQLTELLTDIEWLLSESDASNVPRCSQEVKRHVRAWVCHCLQNEEPKHALAELGLFLYKYYVHGQVSYATGDRLEPALLATVEQLYVYHRTQNDFTPLVRQFLDVLFLDGAKINPGGARALKNLLSGTFGGNFKEAHRQQLSALFGILAESSTLRIDIQNAPISQPLHPKIEGLIRAELGLDAETSLRRFHVIRAVMQMLLRPMRQKQGVGNCYAVGSLQTLLLQAPERLFEFVFTLITKGELPGKSPGFDLNMMFEIHRRVHPHAPMTLQELLVRVCEFYSMNLRESRKDKFRKWANFLLTQGVSELTSDSPWKRPLIKVLLKTIYFAHESTGQKLAVLKAVGEQTLEWVEGKEELRSLLISCIQQLVMSRPAFRAKGRKVLRFLRSTESAAILDPRPSREILQGDFTDLYTMLGFPVRDVKLHTESNRGDLLTQFEALAQVESDDFFLVGFSGHGFIYHKTYLAPYKERFREYLNQRIVQPGHALTQQLFPLRHRQDIAAQLSLELEHPEEETVQAFCRRMKPHLRSQDQQKTMTNLTNYYARRFPVTLFMESVFPQILKEEVWEDLKEYVEESELRRLTPHQWAHILRVRHALEENSVENTLSGICNAPETWKIGDLFWREGSQENAHEVYAYLTFDVVSERPCLLLRGVHVCIYEPLNYFGSYLEAYLPE